MMSKDVICCPFLRYYCFDDSAAATPHTIDVFGASKLPQYGCGPVEKLHSKAAMVYACKLLIN